MMGVSSKAAMEITATQNRKPSNCATVNAGCGGPCSVGASVASEAGMSIVVIPRT